MEIWIFQTGEPLHIDLIKYRPMRAVQLSNVLANKKHNVIIWSSSFFHQERTHRSRSFSSVKINPYIEIRLIPSSGYDKNISFSRLLDHIELAFNLRKALKSENRIPDVAFVGYPPIEFASVASSWLLKKNVPYVADVKDQWPEIFLVSFSQPLKFLLKFFTLPYIYFAKKVIFNSTSVCSISPSFLKWSISFAGRRKVKNDFVFPLTSSKENSDSVTYSKDVQFWKIHGVYKSEITRFFFAGSFSTSFDFKTIKNAVLIAKKNNLKFQFVFCGGGSYINNVKKEFAGFDNVVFPGWVQIHRFNI